MTTTARVYLTKDELLAGWPAWCYWPKSPFEAYARNFSRLNYWRVRASVGSLEDCLQECACKWTYCRNLYANSVNNAAWFMSLYKLGLASTFNSLAAKDAKARTMVVESVEPWWEPPDHQEGPLLVSLAGASNELRAVLAMLADAPAEALDCFFDGRSEKMHNRRLLRFAHQSTSRNVLAELRGLLLERKLQGDQGDDQQREAERLRAEAQAIRAKSHAHLQTLREMIAKGTVAEDLRRARQWVAEARPRDTLLTSDADHGQPPPAAPASAPAQTPETPHRARRPSLAAPPPGISKSRPVLWP